MFLALDLSNSKWKASASAPCRERAQRWAPWLLLIDKLHAIFLGLSEKPKPTPSTFGVHILSQKSQTKWVGGLARFWRFVNYADVFQSRWFLAEERVIQILLGPWWREGFGLGCLEFWRFWTFNSKMKHWLLKYIRNCWSILNHRSTWIIIFDFTVIYYSNRNRDSRDSLKSMSIIRGKCPSCQRSAAAVAEVRTTWQELGAWTAWFSFFPKQRGGSAQGHLSMRFIGFVGRRMLIKVKSSRRLWVKT